MSNVRPWRSPISKSPTFSEINAMIASSEISSFIIRKEILSIIFSFLFTNPSSYLLHCKSMASIPMRILNLIKRRIVHIVIKLFLCLPFNHRLLVIFILMGIILRYTGEGNIREISSLRSPCTTKLFFTNDLAKLRIPRNSTVNPFPKRFLPQWGKRGPLCRRSHERDPAQYVRMCIQPCSFQPCQ